MKKVLFTLLCIIPLFLNAQSLYPFKLKKEAKLYKKRKVETIKTYDNSIDSENPLRKIETFNKDGQVVKMEQIGTKGSLLVQYEYNKKGLLMRQSRTSKDGTFRGSVDYDYKEGFLIHEKHTVKPQTYTITYHYDNSGHLDSSFISSAESQRDVWHYNEYGQVSAVLGYNTQDYDFEGHWILEYKELFYYDEDNGLLTQSCSCFGHLCYIDKHHYNKKKQKIETLEYEGKQLLSRTNYTYNKNGLLLKIESTPEASTEETASKTITTLEYSHW